MGLFSKVAGSFVKERITNTKSALEIIAADFKRYILIVKWIFLICSLGNLVYNVITNTGNIILNFVSIGVLVLYGILDTIFRILKKPNPNKKVRIIYAWIRIGLNAVALFISIYPLYTATSGDSIKPFSIILTTLSLLLFVIKVVLEICMEIFSSKWTLLKNAMILDAKEHPSTSGKLFGPFIGDIEDVDVKETIIDKLKKHQNKENK